MARGPPKAKILPPSRSFLPFKFGGMDQPTRAAGFWPLGEDPGRPGRPAPSGRSRFSTEYRVQAASAKPPLFKRPVQQRKTAANSGKPPPQSKRFSGKGMSTGGECSGPRPTLRAPVFTSGEGGGTSRHLVPLPAGRASSWPFFGARPPSPATGAPRQVRFLASFFRCDAIAPTAPRHQRVGLVCCTRGSRPAVSAGLMAHLRVLARNFGLFQVGDFGDVKPSAGRGGFLVLFLAGVFSLLPFGETTGGGPLFHFPGLSEAAHLVWRAFQFPSFQTAKHFSSSFLGGSADRIFRPGLSGLGPLSPLVPPLG